MWDYIQLLNQILKMLTTPIYKKLNHSKTYLSCICTIIKEANSHHQRGKKNNWDDKYTLANKTSVFIETYTNWTVLKFNM